MAVRLGTRQVPIPEQQVAGQSLPTMGAVQTTAAGTTPRLTPPAPTPIPGTVKDPYQFKPVEWEDYQTPEMDTAYNLQKYTGEDSPLMVQAKAQAQRQQIASGRLNTQGTIGAIQNLQYLRATPLAQADTDRAYQVALARYGQDASDNITLGVQQIEQDFKADLFGRQLDADSQNLMAKIFGDQVGSQLAAMGRIMGTPDATWTQQMQDDFENSINASKEWLGGLFDIPLAGV
ncbi:MAG: hypothetical protein KAS93_08130 [Gammaproteobacteria bacterium]|nr:hypothetical protein [Gammaproteobacteria bacterium]